MVFATLPMERRALSGRAPPDGGVASADSHNTIEQLQVSGKRATKKTPAGASVSKLLEI